MTLSVTGRNVVQKGCNKNAKNEKKVTVVDFEGGGERGGEPVGLTKKKTGGQRVQRGIEKRYKPRNPNFKKRKKGKKI